MINIFPLRVGVLTAVLLLTTAMGAPSMAASLPELSPRQIASDVKMSHNPQTGTREFIAPSFDPFEDDRELAGTALLRSAANEVTIDGQNLRGGAMLDLSFYYNSNSDDPYDNRGYSDAVFLSGEYAPVTQRDARVLECSEKVRDVVYYHEDYYAPSFYLNLYRPYRHYSGFNGFGRHGYGGYSPYGYAGSNYGRNNRGHSRRAYNGNRTRGQNGGGRARNDNRNENHRDRSGSDNSDRSGNDRVRNSETRRRVSESERGLAIGRRTDGDRARRRGQNARNVGMSPRVGSRMNRRLENNDQVRPQSVATPRVTTSAPRVRTAPPTAPRIAPTPRTAPQAAAPAQATPRRSTPRRAEPRVRQTRDRIRNEVRSSREIKSRNSPRLGGKRLMSLSPMASFFGRSSNRRVASQCAREEKLSLHIPQARLDAARFDGLTVLILGRSGEELPVFIPPNYIEGFRQAAGGQISAPVYSSSAPRSSGTVHSVPTYSPPQTAACPAGTTSQSDGTCLTTSTTSGYSGYPTR